LNFNKLQIILNYALNAQMDTRCST